MLNAGKVHLDDTRMGAEAGWRLRFACASADIASLRTGSSGRGGFSVSIQVGGGVWKR